MHERSKHKMRRAPLHFGDSGDGYLHDLINENGRYDLTDPDNGCMLMRIGMCISDWRERWRRRAGRNC